MGDGQDPEKGAEERKPLTLKRTLSAGTVRQSFSHGRTKTVVVETKSRRTLTKPGAKPAAEPVKEAVVAEAPAPKPATAPKPAAAATQTAVLPRSGGLSDAEMKARTEALRRAKEDEDERRERDRIEAEARAKRDAEERSLLAQSREADEDEIEEVAATAAPVATDGAEAPAFADASGDADAAPMRTAPATPERDTLAELGGRVKRAGKQLTPAPVVKPISRGKDEQRRRQGRLTITAVTSDSDEKGRSLASVRRAREKEKQRRLAGGGKEERDKVVREVVIPEIITVQELANRMAERVKDVVMYLMRQGQMVRAIDPIDADTAELIVSEFGHVVKRVAESDVETGLSGETDDPADLVTRPPVVTIMGHVDHGKTSLLDALRQTDVAAGEAGGITQHIGAYQVRLPNGDRVSFLDTPGHAAFSSMRSRGAQVTDIVVLVVSADDGIMPQTIEAISHAKAAGAPIIVAINKIDKPGANAAKIQQDLLSHDLQTEAYGGDVQAIEVSATKKIGLDKLVEAITLQAELMELKANPTRPAEATVVEAKLDKGRGPVATALISRGTLRRGDIVVVGSVWGRVRALMNERGQQVAEAGPSEPVEVLGLESVPEPGDSLFVVENEARAREVSDYRGRMKREQSLVPTSARASLEQMMARLKTDEVRDLPLILKADVQGSVEAITHALGRLSTEEVRARVIMGAVGGITESDVDLAKSSGAPLIAFNVRANAQARDMAQREGVEIRYYSIIYNLLDDIRDTLSGMLKPELRERFLGYAQILEVFNITKVGKVAGCRVTEGVVKRGSGVRLLRDNVVIHEGKLGTLKRFKDEVPEVTSGMECGMGFENYQDIRTGDQIECFEVEVIKRALENKG
ncbi:MAG: translation initiation factor IF-2 [Caulobacterales bacterium]